MRFDLARLRFSFTALDAVHFPSGQAANLLRGAFGLALESGQYARLFAPRSAPGGPSGLADPPRPFVFRARHLEGLTLRPGDAFHFDLHLFTAAPGALDAVSRAFRAAAHRGIGPGRGRAAMAEPVSEPVSLSLAPASAPPRVRIDFLSAIELKHQGRIVEVPDFAVLFARIRDRVSSLRALYGPGPLPVDFAAMGARAAAVERERSEWRRIEAGRRSSRTGQSHSLGGFTGFAEYAGPLSESLPYLEAARWTGVGRQAVWGKGEIAVSPLPAPGPLRP